MRLVRPLAMKTIYKKRSKKHKFKSWYKNYRFLSFLKDVRAHCYSASLVRALYMTWRVSRHVFQARAPSRNFFFGRSLPFLSLSIILENKKNLFVGSFDYFSYTVQIGSNWYMDTGLRDLEVACFKVNST